MPLTAKQEKILDIKTHNPEMSGCQVARVAKCDPSYAIEILERYGLTKESITDYKEHRANVLAGLQHRLLSNISQEQLEKAPLGTKILAACQLIDKEQQLTGGLREVKPLIIVNRVTVEGKVPEGQVIDVQVTQNDTHNVAEIAPTNDINDLDSIPS